MDNLCLRFVRSYWIILTLAGLLIFCAGCKSHPAIHPTTTASTADLSSATFDADVQALVTPPAGWRADPLKQTSRHQHRIWLSPTRNTAYGVIHFSLPIPVSHDLALWGFLQEMKRSEGQSTLITRQWDETLGGLRFVADGNLYRVRASLFVRGWQGWAIYAGTVRSAPIDPVELDLAERAREHTSLSQSK